MRLGRTQPLCLVWGKVRPQTERSSSSSHLGTGLEHTFQIKFGILNNLQPIYPGLNYTLRPQRWALLLRRHARSYPDSRYKMTSPALPPSPRPPSIDLIDFDDSKWASTLEDGSPFQETTQVESRRSLPSTMRADGPKHNVFHRSEIPPPSPSETEQRLKGVQQQQDRRTILAYRRMKKAAREMENARLEAEMILMDADEKYTAILSEAMEKATRLLKSARATQEKTVREVLASFEQSTSEGKPSDNMINGLRQIHRRHKFTN